MTAREIFTESPHNYDDMIAIFRLLTDGVVVEIKSAELFPCREYCYDIFHITETIV